MDPLGQFTRVEIEVRPAGDLLRRLHGRAAQHLPVAQHEPAFPVLHADGIRDVVDERLQEIALVGEPLLGLLSLRNVETGSDHVGRATDAGAPTGDGERQHLPVLGPAIHLDFAAAFHQHLRHGLRGTSLVLRDHEIENVQRRHLRPGIPAQELEITVPANHASILANDEE